MPNIKAAAKRVRADKKRRQRNLGFQSELKTLTRRFLEALQPGKEAQAKEFFRTLSKRLDQAVNKGIIHKNTASRKKSRYAARLAKKGA